MAKKYNNVLPGFNLSLGFTIFYLSLIVLIPLSAAFIKTSTLSLHEFWVAVASPRVVASYKLTFGASLIGASINAVFGLLTAWVLTRYTFPGKRIIDALVDLPFALPTAYSWPRRADNASRTRPGRDAVCVTRVLPCWSPGLGAVPRIKRPLPSIARSEEHSVQHRMRIF